MRKLLLFFFALLTGVSGAWAQTTEADFTIITGICSPSKLGSFSKKSGSNYQQWLSTNGVTVSAGSDYVLNEGMSTNSGGYGRCLKIIFSAAESHTITLTAPEDMTIKAYSMKVKGSTSDLTFTMTDEGGTGTTVSNTTLATFSDEGLSNRSTSFTVASSKAAELWISELTLTLVADADVYTIYKVYYDGSEVIHSNFVSLSSVTGAEPSLPSDFKRAYCDYSYYSDESMTSPLSTITSSNSVVYVNCQLVDCPIVFSTVETPRYYTIKSAWNPSYYLSYASAAIATVTTTTASSLWAFIGNPYEFKLYNLGKEGYLTCNYAYSNGSSMSIGATGSKITLFSNAYPNGATSPVVLGFTPAPHGLINCQSSFTYDYNEAITKNVVSVDNYKFSTMVLTEVTNFAPYVLQIKEGDDYTSAGELGYPTTTCSEYTALKTNLENYSESCTYSQYADVVSAYTSYLTTTADADIVKPTTNAFYRLKGALSGKYLKGAASTTENHTGQWLNTANQEGALSIFYLNSDNKLVGYANGRFFTKTSSIADVAVSTEGRFVFEKFNTTFGALAVKEPDASGGGLYLYSWTDSNDYVDRSGKASQTDWFIEEVDKLPVTISSAKYATLYAPVALEVPEGVTAFWGEDDGTQVIAHAINSGNVIPANIGVILYSETADTYDFAITTGGSISGTDAITGVLYTQEKPSGAFTLQNGEHGVAFYADAVSNLQGFKAYLPASSGHLVKGIVFDFETTVKAIEAAMNPGKMVYDMNGRRVENPTKGVYIVNGKKVIIK